MEIKGRDLISGIPKTLTINEAEIREALTEPVNVILDTIRVILENTPPELAADIVDRGIILAGGGALLKGLDLLIRQETGLPVFIADDPLSAVVRGVGKMLDDIEMLRRVSINL
jgi:rod shape-determining protein MreB